MQDAEGETNGKPMVLGFSGAQKSCGTPLSPVLPSLGRIIFSTHFFSLILVALPLSRIHSKLANWIYNGFGKKTIASSTKRTKEVNE